MSTEFAPHISIFWQARTVSIHYQGVKLSLTYSISAISCIAFLPSVCYSVLRSTSMEAIVSVNYPSHFFEKIQLDS
jgi:hypothetical protein